MGNKAAGESGPGPDPASLNFEEAMAELEGIVARLEEGRIPLDQAIAVYERGAALKAHCEARLAEARSKVERITLGPGGSAGVEPAGIDQADNAES